MISLKTTQEIELMQENGRILSVILTKVKHQAKPGVSTMDLAEYALELMTREKCKPAFLGYKGFPGAICVSVNDEVVHGIPNKKRILQVNDLVKIDVGIRKDGFFADMAETVYLGGEIPDEIDTLMKSTKNALMAGIRNAIAGNTLGKISRSIEKSVENSGMSVIRRFVGHGIGRSLHEKPPVPNFGPENQGPRLEVGMVLAIEPIVTNGDPEVFIKNDGWTAVTRHGNLSAHFEHMVAVTECGPKILTSTCQAG
ncbi:MAG: methionyl aminopeptidase [Clostridiales bacterium]|nr:methionyl aminopeptidase [Clostridiales bacterium]MDN5280936.1 methionyl aminopeptidase [Candidatus Ozemobacter sp.]